MPVTKYIWDQENYLAEADGGDAIQSVFTTTGDGLGTLVSTRQDGSTYYPHFDAVGSTRQLSTLAAVTDTWTYDSSGTVKDRTGTSRTPFQWIGAYGYYKDDETAGYWVRTRAFTSATFRWASRDPLGHYRSGVANLYQYSRNSPILFADPTGLIEIFSRSGINDTGEDIEADIRAYVKGRAGDATYGGHQASDIKLKDLLERFQLDKTLNVEADAKARRLRKIKEFCCDERKFKIGVVMIGPKTYIPNLETLTEDNDCCEIEFLILRSSWDLVPNQKLARSEYLQDWSGAGTVIDIRLGGLLNHSWRGGAGQQGSLNLPNFFEYLAGANGSPFDPSNKLMATNWRRKPGLDEPELISGSAPPRNPGKVFEGIRVLSGAAEALTNLMFLTHVPWPFWNIPYASTGSFPLIKARPISVKNEIDEMLADEKDFGFVCHSQGCNITSKELQRACLGKFLPTPD